jgi:hypothetical protein
MDRLDPGTGEAVLGRTARSGLRTNGASEEDVNNRGLGGAMNLEKGG